ncbi:MAG: restriction endonuclease subunit S, partial [Dehalobacterium sp.]
DFVDDEALIRIHARSDIKVGDILFTSIEPIGRLYLINETPEDWDINESVFSIRTNESVVSREYLYSTLDSDLFRSQISPLKTGSVQKGIRIGALESIKIIIPDAETMLKFTVIITPIHRAHGLREKEKNDLIALRDFLLPLLMNGQVSVGTGAVTEKTPTKQQSVFKRLVLSAYILDNICDEPTAGRVKFEKLLYLSEYCAEIDLHSDFHRHAAGPYDPKALHSIEEQLKKNKWFGRNTDKTQSRAYVRLGRSDGYKPYVETNLQAKQKNVIDRLIRLFKTTRTIQCEIVATLFGAWNDFLIEGVQPTDDQIVNEVLTNWHERKERIDRKRWLNALGWMRQNDIIPVGYGTSTKGC